MSSMMRRWNDEMGRRSSRPAALTIIKGSSLLCEGGHAARGEGFRGKGGVFVERVLLCVDEKLLATARRGRIELQNPLDELVQFLRQAAVRANLRDQPDFQGA